MIGHGKYRIRLLERGDLPFVTRVRTSSHVQDHVGQVVFVNEESQSRWFESLDATQLYAVFQVQEGERSWVSLGYVRITDIDHRNKNMCVGGDIAEEHCGQGHGTEMYKLIFKLGFDVWNMHRLWLLVLENNKRARKLYEKIGFVEEGVQREAIYKDGKYENYVIMSLLRKEYDA